MSKQTTKLDDNPELMPEYINFVSKPVAELPSTVRQVDIPNDFGIITGEAAMAYCDSTCNGDDPHIVPKHVSIFDIWHIPHDSTVYNVEAVGNSMEPYICEGNDVYFVPSKKPNPGNTVVVEHHGASIIKDLFYFEDLKSWWLCSRNKQHLPIPLTTDNEYLFLGTVIEVRKPIDKPDKREMAEQVKAYLGIDDLRAAGKSARIMRVLYIVSHATDDNGSLLVYHAQDWAYVFRVMAENHLFEFNSYTDFIRYLRSDKLEIARIPNNSTLCHQLSRLRGSFPHWVMPDDIRQTAWDHFLAIGARTYQVLLDV